MMTSFLVKDRTKETYLQKISSEPQGTQQNRIVMINNFERFVNELYEEKTIESVIEELEKNESIDKKLLRYLTIRVKKFDLDTNYFSKKEDEEKKESSKN